MQTLRLPDLSQSLTASARSVFRKLAHEGPATRPQLGVALGLSRPTMSAAMAELEQLGYVEVVGSAQGALGRKAAVYRAGRGAGHVIAVDAGSTHVRLRVSSVDRRLLHSSVHHLPVSQFVLNEQISQAVANEVRKAIAMSKPEWGNLRALGIALPSRVVNANGDTPATGQDEVFSRFVPPNDVQLVLENNVNCAAVAEHLYGAAKQQPTFAYIQIGLKIGMGLMLDGKLVRGRNGAAGEIGHMAFPFAPGRMPVSGEIERYMGAEALMGRTLADWPPSSGRPPADTSELLQRAESGEEAALRHVMQHADDIGALVASCVSIVDPGLVVLGGGLGSAEMLLPQVREVANRLSYPVEVKTSILGPDATVLGIEKLAVDKVMEVLLAEEAG
ncbi:ROK family transcriptional regulator [Nitratireductor thuwali]|uniref:N-acetyl-D-glucosamine kinase n=1 Tax=Nitratireductor thuwali TaxID=2267699 RepID=A0ABY5MMK0_9HYPH|nr:N-acetyl-D-glucosamine kinase [Nitratireductor thuwali]